MQEPKKETKKTETNQRPPDTVNLNEFNFSQVELKSRSTSNKSANSEITKLVHSANGCSVDQAKKILYGSVEKAGIADPDGKGTRKELRTAWRQKKIEEIAVAQTNTAEGQRYFVIHKNALDSFVKASQDAYLKVKIDKNQVV